MILGTAAYMSPEQAKGQAADKRSDIWAFGCVLYEMLSRKRAFGGEGISDTLAAVLRGEPDWSAMPTATPRAIQTLLRRCLKKDRKRRLQAIGEARIQLDELIGRQTTPGSDAATPFRRLVLAAITALVGGALIGALVMWAMVRPASRTRVLSSRFEITPPPTQPLAMQGADRDIAISPDGHYIVYRAHAGLAQLVVRAIDRLDAHPLADITNARQPFFSADSQWIGFFDGAGLKKVPAMGGSPIPIGKNYIVPRGASWGDDNSIVFATTDTSSGLLRVPASGGEPTLLTRLDAAKGEKNHWRPSLLPGSRGVLFTITALNPRGACAGGRTRHENRAAQDADSWRNPTRVRRDGAPVVCGCQRTTRRAVRSWATRGAERSGAGRRRRDDGCGNRGQLRGLAIGHARLCPRVGRAEAAIARVGRSQGAGDANQGATAHVRRAATVARRHTAGAHHPRSGKRRLDLGFRA